ncbi:RNA polymerase-binding transcription factor DksA [Microbacterium hydrocarbonoxydans]|uniref:RNA polymerase-binding transcription factor DksA n=2 Tax=Microbacterium hydrocarbonoxydans TaxID=273678 RepID=A0A1H4IQV5_9MICO|nr:RNA polymerase-binding transcription factor DksA [Microbacterium hydrocarbonoxydans]
MQAGSRGFSACMCDLGMQLSSRGLDVGTSAYSERMTQDARTRLELLRTQAAERVETTAATLAELMHDREGSNDDDEHDPEGVTLSSEWSRLTGLAEAAASELRQVDDALARLDADTYGVCANCGRPIPGARLEVRPFATHCVACAEKLGL